MTGQFVHVIKVAETPPESAGLLRNYHWLDATGEPTAQLLNEISARLPLGDEAVAAGR